ncbi:MAG: ferredoxin [Methanoregula sp.]|jgi:ferredoxin|uniref:ferredoxin n=1 Tax=Methanoregula sp. TaxID=2052170 RepID=UPI003D10B597
MKVTIDRINCVSCQSCWETCPDFFEENPDDSFSQITSKYRLDGKIAEGTAPAEQEECVMNAADLCPVQIIRLEQ